MIDGNAPTLSCTSMPSCVVTVQLVLASASPPSAETSFSVTSAPVWRMTASVSLPASTWMSARTTAFTFAVAADDVIGAGGKPKHAAGRGVRHDGDQLAGLVLLQDLEAELLGRDRPAVADDGVELQAAGIEHQRFHLVVVGDGDALGRAGAPEGGVDQIVAGREAAPSSSRLRPCRRAATGRRRSAAR